MLLPLLAVVAGLLWAPTAAAVTIQVDITPDNSTDDGFCTLREAITATNGNADVNGTDATADCDHDGGTGSDTITFGPGFDGSDIIPLGSALPAITGTLAIEGAAGPNCPAAPAPCVEVQGDGTNDVITFSATSGSSVRGLAVTNGQHGIFVSGASTGTKIAGNWLGVKLDGTSDPNTNGVQLSSSSSGTTVGGTAAADRNVFYANTNNLGMSFSDGNFVQGNWFGLLPDGTAGAVAPNFNIALVGSLADRANNNVIGVADATTPGVCDLGCNVISRASFDGIELDVTNAEGATNTTVVGNFIGLDPAGSADRGNGVGIAVGAADGTTIGGATAADRNYIAGNSKGVEAKAGAADTTVRNNFSGLTAGGSAAVPDVFSGVDLVTVDPDTVVADNRFAGNGADPGQGLLLNNGASDVQVRGNTFGTGTGGEPLGFQLAAINVNGGDNNVIGGTGLGEGNVIGNAPIGVQLSNTANDNTLIGNLIGTDAGGADIGNTSGVLVGPGSMNTIGAGTAASENVISNSTGDAIRIALDGSDQNSIGRNRGSANGGLFIDLEETFGSLGNGFGNTTSGPNAGIQEPVVTSARRRRDRVNGTGIPGATVRVYRAEATAGSAPTGLLKFLGEKVIGPAGTWKLNPAGRLKKGWVVSANQTEPDGDSSELALGKKARR